CMRELHLHEHVSTFMFNRLKAANWTAELISRFGVVNRVLHSFSRTPERFRAHESCSRQQSASHSGGRIFGSNKTAYGPIECHSCQRSHQVEYLKVLCEHPGSNSLHCNNRQWRSVSRLSCNHVQDIGESSVDNEFHRS